MVTFTALTVIPGSADTAAFYLNMAIKADHDFSFFNGDKDTELKAGKYYSIRFAPSAQKYPKHNDDSFELSEIDKSKYENLVSSSVKKVPDKLKSLKWGN